MIYYYKGCQQENKLNYKPFEMIRANRELTTDRKLFKNIQKQCNTLQFDCQPHQKQQITKLTEQIFVQVQTALMSQIQQLNRKIESLSSQLHRLDAIIKFKKQKKLFSFANSPSSKTHQNYPESAEKYKQSRRSLNIQFNSTEPKTKQKQKYNTFTKYNDGSQQKQEYLNQQMSNLKRQIVQLKDQLFRVHSWNNENIPGIQSNRFSVIKQTIQQTGYRKLKGVKLFNSRVEETKYKQNSVNQFDLDDYMHVSNPTLTENQVCQRYKAIIAQYQKQQQVLRPMAKKAEKYRNGLRIVLQWLKDLKQVQLQKYLPCQACEIKKALNLFFEGSMENDKQRQLIRRSSQSKNQVFQFSSSYAEDNQQQIDQDSLLMQYDRNQVGSSQS